MNRNRILPLLALLALHCADRAYGATVTAPDIVLTPTAVNFSYTISGTAPAALPLGFKSTGTTAFAFTLVVTQPAACSAPCLTVSASSGTTPASVKVYMNPMGLAAGTYVGNIKVTAPGAVTPVQNVVVALNIGNQASALTPSTTTVPFNYTTGPGVTAQSAKVSLTSDGSALTATIAVAGGTWLTATPTGSIAVIGLPQFITITADAAGLAPSVTPYKGTVTVTSSNASNKSIVINVTLAVSAGVPTIAAVNGIWPPGAPAGSTQPVTITITGSNYTSSSTASSGATALTNITVVNANTMLASIPVSLLATAAALPIVITTPSAASTSAAGSFSVYDPTIPQVWAVVNGASYNSGVVSPGEIITIYGAGLGPTGVTPFPAAASLPLTLGTPGATSVTINNGTTDVAAPLLYTSPTQISCIVPLSLATKAIGTSVPVYVTYNGVKSTKPFPVNVIAADPGIFILDSSGQGAILNIDTTVTPNNYTVNGAKNPATKGTWISIYATGFGVTTCTSTPKSTCDVVAPTEAQFVGGGTVMPTGTLGVTIGGQAVTTPVGVVPVGSVIGLLQINAMIPAAVTPGNAVPVVVSIAGVKSAGVATMVVK